MDLKKKKRNKLHYCSILYFVGTQSSNIYVNSPVIFKGNYQELLVSWLWTTFQMNQKWGQGGLAATTKVPLRLGYYGGQRDGSAGQVLATQTRWSEFNTQNPKKEAIYSTKLSSTPQKYYGLTSTHTHKILTTALSKLFLHGFVLFTFFVNFKHIHDVFWSYSPKICFLDIIPSTY